MTSSFNAVATLSVLETLTGASDHAVRRLSTVVFTR